MKSFVVRPFVVILFCTERVAHRLLISAGMDRKKQGTAIDYVLGQCLRMDIGRQGRISSGPERIYSDEPAKSSFIGV